ncbi:MAG: DUF7019 family protein [Planctomycetota bacterium]|jgi:hypothetical protein
MRYYVYISDQKVDMLLSQISTAQKKKIATEFKISLQLLSASRRTEVDSTENRIKRLEAVAEFIRQNENVGSVNDPRAYFSGEMTLRWGPYPESWEDDGGNLVYFGGTTDDTILGLGGSSRHVVGNTGGSHPYSASAAPYLVSYLCNELQLPTDNDEVEHLGLRPGNLELELMAVHLASTGMDGPEQRLEFIAKRLLHGPSPYPDRDPKPGLKVLLGTPLYVAMSE